MSQENQIPARAEEPELTDDALEQVAGGCAVNSHLHDPVITVMPPTFPMPIDGLIKTVEQ